MEEKQQQVRVRSCMYCKCPLTKKESGVCKFCKKMTEGE